MYRLLVQTFPNNEVRQTLTKVRESRIGSSDACPAELSPSESAPPLTLVRNSELPETPTRRPPTRFGNNARRCLMRAGGALDKIIGNPGEVLFLTGTLPGSTPEAYQAIADYAHIIVDRLKSWLSKRVQSRYEFYVWELQKRGALHLHYAVHVKDYEIGERILAGFKRQWCRLLNLVGKLANVNLYQRGFGDRRIHRESTVQAYSQRVNKSVAAYLAKYCGKEAGKLHLRPVPYYPRRWWGQSRPLKRLVDSLTKTFWLTFTNLSSARSKMITIHDELESLSVYQYSYRHKVGVGETSLSYVMVNLWKTGLNMISNRLNGTPSSPMVEILSSSLTLRMLTRLTANYQALMNVTGTGKDQRVMHLIVACKTVASNWQDLRADSIGRWVNALCALSSELTCNQYLRIDSRYWQDLNRHPVHHLLKLREYLYRNSNYSWEDIKFFDEVLDKGGFE